MIQLSEKAAMMAFERAKKANMTLQTRANGLESLLKEKNAIILDQTEALASLRTALAESHTSIKHLTAKMKSLETLVQDMKAASAKKAKKEQKQAAEEAKKVENIPEDATSGQKDA